MLTPCTLAITIRLWRKLKFLGSAFCLQISFLIYEFLCLRNVNYEAFKYTCAALRTARKKRGRKSLLVKYAPILAGIS